MIYIKGFLICLVVVLVSFFAFFLCLFRWGDVNLNHDIARCMSRISLAIAGIRIEVEGQERLDPSESCIFICNHQSNFDVLVIGSFYPKRALVIGKREIILYPFFGLAYVAAGNFLLNRRNHAKAIAGLNKALAIMKKKNASLFVFPEGTRNLTGDGLLPFKKGAFHMAISAGVPIVPIVVGPLHSVFDWKHRKLQPGVLPVQVLEPIRTEGYTSKQVDELSALARGKMLEALHGLSTRSTAPSASRFHQP